MRSYLDFEKPVAELEAKIEELRALQADDESGAIADEIARLEAKAAQALKELYAGLTPWQKTQVARHPQRPHCLDYVAALITDFVPLAGDRKYADDEAIVITGARTKLPASALPLTVDVLGGQALDDQVAVSGSVIDVVSARLPAFSPTREKLSGSGETLRGRSPLYAINGVPQSPPIRDGSRDGFTIDPFFIDRVEVIYGSNALQGIGATGGVVNQVTVGAPAQDGVSIRTLLQGTAAEGFDGESMGGKVGALAGWLGTGLGLAVSSFQAPPAWIDVAPAVINFLGLGVFQVGAATFVSSWSRTRSQAVAIVVAAYVVELALMLVSRISPSAKWLAKFTYQTAYEPTMLTIVLRTTGISFSKKVTNSRDMPERAATLVGSIPDWRWRSTVSVTMVL